MYEHDALLALGFKTDTQPSKQAIKKAYRAAALKHHPDKLSFPNGATEEEKKAIKSEQKECFEEISTAYDCLLHPEKPEHSRGGAERDLSKMSAHEYMSRQHGYSYTSQFTQVHGDESQKYHVNFDCYILNEELHIAPEIQGTSAASLKYGNDCIVVESIAR